MTNETKDYHDAFSGIAFYVYIMQHIRSKNQDLDLQVGKAVLEAISKQTLKDSELLGKIDGLEERHGLKED